MKGRERKLFSVLTQKVKLISENQFAKPTSHLIIAQFSMIGFLILADVIFARIFTEQRYGSWKQVILIMNLFIPILAFGIPEGFKYYAAKEIQSIQKHLYTVISIIFSFFLVIVLFATLPIARQLFTLFNNEDLFQVYYLLPVLYILVTLTRVYKYYAITISKTGHFLTFSIISIFICAGLLGFYYLFFQHFNDSYLFYSGLILIAFFAIRLICLSISYQIYKINFSLKISMVSKYLKFGIPLYLASFIGIISVNLDKAIVMNVEAIEIFAIYAVGAFEIPIFAMISGAVSQSYFPEMVKLVNAGQEEKAKKIWMSITKKVSLLTYPLIAICIFFSKDIIQILYTEKYIDATPILQTYFLLGIWRNNYYGAIITAKGQTKWITIYGVSGLGLNLILSIFLYQYFGYMAVVYGTLCATTFVALAQLYHERMLKSFVKTFILDKKVIILIIIILTTFFIR